MVASSAGQNFLVKCRLDPPLLHSVSLCAAEYISPTKSLRALIAPSAADEPAAPLQGVPRTCARHEGAVSSGSSKTNLLIG